MLLGWKHSGFCVHRSKLVRPDQKEDPKYIIRNPFSVESRAEGETGCPQGSNRAKRSGNMHPDPETGTIIYRSGMNPKIRLQLPFTLFTPARSCRLSPFGRLEIFSPCDFIAAITQHIPDKNFQLVRYYGWYANKMRGQRNKLAASRDGAVELFPGDPFPDYSVTA